jgi:hypothetical protein
MATIDLSRLATNFTKHFDSARMQQGRVLTDDDFNEHAQLNSEDTRETRVDVIGPAGSPDEGFRIDSPQMLNGKLTFVIKAGVFYLGGLRLTLEQDEYYHLQKDWLQQSEDPADRLGTPTAPRCDLVYLEAWRQPVSAVEDSELFEVALGSRDTSTRIRTMRRVRVRQGVTATDCEAAFQTLLNDLGTQGTLNDEAELVPDARLKVEPDGTTGTPDLCSPPVAGGYLGAENQAIRVQLVSANEFTWGFDNAAPLYRVQLATNPSTGLRTEIVMLTEPADQAHWPLSGQVVELLPWSAALVNNQKLAEMHGHLAKVTGSYNPNTKTFSIDIAPPQSVGSPAHPFGEHWRERNDPGISDSTILDDEGDFFYLRVWNRGSDLASPARIPLSPVPSLGNTGLQVTFTGTQFRPGDFWIIAARPDSPSVLVPWDFDPARPPYGLLPYDGRPPHGVQRWLTPLCVIKWTPGPTLSGEVLHDCREYFPPLTRIRTCCTYSVGDGTHSHGQFNSIQAAVNQLPAEGGKICLLPGVYQENVRIVNKRNITICGCGNRSIVRSRGPTPPNTAAMPVISIIGGFNIALECFAVEAHATGLGILVRGKNLWSEQAQEALTEVIGVVFSELSVTAAQQGAVRARFVRDFVVRCCTLANLDQSSADQTLVVLGDDVLIERNVVEVAAMRDPELPPPDPTEPPEIFVPGTSARGGIQIEGLSDRVRIINNLIHGGSSNGITLGSVIINASEPSNDPNDGDLPWLDPCDPCNPIENILYDPTESGGVTIVDGGPLSEVRIERNRIYDMGACGIGVARFFDLRSNDVFIHVDQLTILGNHIRHCLQREIAEPAPAVASFVGYGGIALADVHQLIAYDNVIENCGLSPGEPVCGIFVLQVEGCDLHRNRILENGVGQNDDLENINFKVGHRGGIIIMFALAPVPTQATQLPSTYVRPPRYRGAELVGTSMPTASREPAARIRPNVVITPELPTFEAVGSDVAVTSMPTLSGEPAARIHDNIITTPVGRALHLNALGAVSVEGNHFTSRGIVPGFSMTDAFSSQLAATVWLLDLGFSNEDYNKFLPLSTLGKSLPTVQPGLEMKVGLSRRLATGQVLFNDNRVTFNALDGGRSFASSSKLAAGSMMAASNPAPAGPVTGGLPAPAVVTAPAGPATGVPPTGTLTGSTLVASSILIFTLDDLGFQDNHCEAYVRDQELVLVNAGLLGVSLRANSNRFTEGTMNALFSAVTVSGLSTITFQGGAANTTTINQATHCILALGPKLKFELNTVIFGVNPLLNTLVSMYLGKDLDLDLTCDQIQRAISRTDTGEFTPRGLEASYEP